MKTVREIKLQAIVDARTHGASEPEIWRLASLNGWDSATIEAGPERARRTVARASLLSRTH